jgi:hypothetical protein
MILIMYKAEILDMLEDYYENHVNPKTPDELKRELNAVIDKHLSSYREQDLVHLVYSYGFDEAFHLVNLSDLLKGDAMRTLAKAVYLDYISTLNVWEKFQNKSR